MTTIVRFTDGQLLDLSLTNDTDVLLTLSLTAKNIRHSVVLFIGGKLVVYRILRKNKEAGPIRTLLNQVEENLLLHYNFEMKGLIWGQPAIARIKGRYWWMLNELLVIDELGNFSPGFQDTMNQYNIANPDSSALLTYFESVRDTAILQTVVN